VAVQRTFDAFGRLASYPLGNPSGSGIAAGATRTVNYDAADRITGYSHSSPGAALDQLFGYDGLDRLTSASQGASSFSYAYDATGNRTQAIINGTTYNHTVSQVNSNAGSYQPDDLVNVIPNTYTGVTLTLPASGTSGHPIIYSGTNVILDGNSTNIIGIDANAKNYVTIRNFEIKRCRKGAAVANGSLGDTATRTAGDAGTGLIFKNLWCHNNTLAGTPTGTFGISITGTINATIDSCTIEDESTTSAALRVKAATAPVITNCIARRIVNDGVHLKIVTNAVLEKSFIGPMALNDQTPSAHSDGIVFCKVDGLDIRQNFIREWTQMIYGEDDDNTPLGSPNNAGNFDQNVHIYSNFIFGIPGVTIPQYGDFDSPGDGAPGIFQPNPGTIAYAKNYDIVWNTFGYTGLPGIRIYENGTAGSSASHIVIAGNAFFKTRGSASNSAIDVDSVSSKCFLGSNPGTSCTGDSDCTGGGKCIGRLSNYNDYVTCSSSGFEGGNSITTNPSFTNYAADGSAGFDVSITTGSPLHG
jgi:hypothetical protein